MSEKNPLAGFAEGSSEKKAPGPEILSAGEIKLPIPEGSPKSGDAVVVFDKDTNQVMQVSGTPLSAELLEALTKKALDKLGIAPGAAPKMGDFEISEDDRVKAGEALEKERARKRDIEEMQKGKHPRTIDEILIHTHRITQAHTEIKESEKKQIAKFGSADGTVRLRYYIEGMSIALCWILGINPENPVEYMMSRMRYNPEFACPDPQCESCVSIRQAAEPTHSVPSVGTSK